MFKKELKNIAESIIKSKTFDEEVFGAQLLSRFFSKKQDLDKNNEVVIKEGIALSSFGASACIDDYLRTTRFIKSVFSAINVLQRRFTNEKINILYAGCGPHATLLLPLLPLFEELDLDIILLDINESSIESIKDWLSIIDFENCAIQCLQANAITYVKPTSWEMHLLITETMFQALLREPQVAITKNLVPQLAPNGILIPEEINIDFGYTIFAKESFFECTSDFTADRYATVNYPHFQYGGRLFSINKKLDFGLNTNFDNEIESNFYEIPENFDLIPDVCIFTSLKIFDEFRLNSGQSYITNPFCVASLFNIEKPNSLKLVYNFQTIPEWSYKLKGKED